MIFYISGIFIDKMESFDAVIKTSNKRKVKKIVHKYLTECEEYKNRKYEIDAVDSIDSRNNNILLFGHQFKL